MTDYLIDMKFKNILLLCVTLGLSTPTVALEVLELSIEHLHNPVGISYSEPRFSWVIQSERANVVQVAYQVSVTTGGKEVWNSGKITSDRSNLVEYKGAALVSKTRYEWRVKVWDNYGRESLYSDAAFFETGMLYKGEWKAQWIAAPWEENPRGKNPVHYFRSELKLRKGVVKARIYASAHGLYELHINGRKVGDQEFAPGWTSYKKRLQYQVYDVTSDLQEGHNCLSAMLADGWHRGRIAYRGKDDPFKNQLSLLVQLEVEYENGRTQTFCTDKDWTASTGGILESTIYDGEVFDFTKEPTGWHKVGFDESQWQRVKVLNEAYETLVASHAPPVKVISRKTPVKTYRIAEDAMVYDFGQNLTGRVSIKVEGYDFEKIVVTHGEEIDHSNDLYTKNLRDAQARLVLKIGDKGKYSYTPHFTFMGFRYVKVSGISTHRIHSVKAEVIHSDLQTTGSFECSNPLVNQLYSNIIWGQKGNFLDVPTDCPQRDERLGWTGDVQVFSTTAAYNMDVAAFFNKWMIDLVADQREDGAVPWIIPNVFTKREPATGWADAAVIVPWNMYRMYGDKAILDKQYPSMKAWVDYMVANKEDGLWFGRKHFGDWLSYIPVDKPHIRAAVTEDELLASIFYQHSLHLLSETAAILGKTDEAAQYRSTFQEANASFMDEFITPNGRLVSGTQTAYSLVLAFDLVPVELRKNMVDRLLKNVAQYDHLTTGFLGTASLNYALSESGYSNQAYELLLNTEFPSWLYPVTKGATTIWERWGGKRPEGTFQDPRLNSFNHYAYGAIGGWMMEHAAGIRPEFESPDPIKTNDSYAADGFKTFVIAPEITDSLKFVKASYKSTYGLISSEWRHKEDLLHLNVEIPVNTLADVYCPSGYRIIKVYVLENGVPTPMEFTQQIDSQIGLGSGKYFFELVRNEPTDR